MLPIGGTSDAARKWMHYRSADSVNQKLPGIGEGQVSRLVKVPPPSGQDFRKMNNRQRKYHFPGSVNFGMAGPPPARAGSASFNSWNGDKQQHKPQQDCYRNESCQNADRNSDMRPVIFPGPFAHDYLLIAFLLLPPVGTKSSRDETKLALERINVTGRGFSRADSAFLYLGCGCCCCWLIC
jgi:hypothetical protein